MTKFIIRITVGAFFVIFFAALAFKVIYMEERSSIKDSECECYKAQYTSLCEQYNKAVNSYNSEAERLNSFVDKAAEYNVITQDSPVPLQKMFDMSFADFWSYGKELSALSDRTDELNKASENLREEYLSACQSVYAGIVNDHNEMVKAYRELISHTSVNFISDIPTVVGVYQTFPYDVKADDFDEAKLLEDIAAISAETDKIAGYYIIAEQITAPEEKWVQERLAGVSSIIEQAPVTADNDPLGMLNKEGGYTCCIYFLTDKLDPSSVEGADIIAKGTDAGGCIEVYPDLGSALKRCEYLSQFDDTLLYSGSYAVIGTSVVRTSYKLSTDEQIALTNEITEALTKYDN